MEASWFIGSNGDYFRDMGGYRYCVAHETVGFLADGRRVYKFSANRNGNQLGAALYDTAAEAKAACEHDATKADAGHPDNVIL
jgi:hypothetical protein